jgi:hypothetical protein
MVKKSKVSKIKKSNISKRNIPLGVKILSILNYVSAAFGLLLSLFFLLMGIYFISNPAIIKDIEAASIASSTPLPFPATSLAIIFIVFAIFLLILTVLSFFIGRGLWKGQNWARIAEIVFSVLGIVSGIFSLISDLVNMFTNPSGITNILTNIATTIVSLAINLLIVGYLLLNQEAKRFFEK